MSNRRIGTHWETEDGKKIQIEKLDSSHLRNILKLLWRNRYARYKMATNRNRIRTSAAEVLAWFTEAYYALIAEAERRKLKWVPLGELAPSIGETKKSREEVDRLVRDGLRSAKKKRRIRPLKPKDEEEDE